MKFLTPIFLAAFATAAAVPAAETSLSSQCVIGCVVSAMTPFCESDPTKNCACKPENIDGAAAAAKACVSQKCPGEMPVLERLPCQQCNSHC